MSRLATTLARALDPAPLAAAVSGRLLELEAGST